MRVWSIQNKNILNDINKDGIYFSDFHKSAYLKYNPILKTPYMYILDNFNRINYCNLDGVVFCFGDPNMDKQAIEDDFTRVFTFLLHIYENRHAIEDVWDYLSNENNVLLEIEFDVSFLNPLPVDTNNFSAIIPPITVMPPYDDNYIKRILEDLSKGALTPPLLRNQVLQLHIPFITDKSILNVYSTKKVKEIKEILIQQLGEDVVSDM